MFARCYVDIKRFRMQTVMQKGRDAGREQGCLPGDNK